jgi:hypothetical protein
MKPYPCPLCNKPLLGRHGRPIDEMSAEDFYCSTATSIGSSHHYRYTDDAPLLPDSDLYLEPGPYKEYPEYCFNTEYHSFVWRGGISDFYIYKDSQIIKEYDFITYLEAVKIVKRFQELKVFS